MKRITAIITGVMCLGAVQPIVAERPDSVWVYLYTTPVDNNHDGLHWAWSADQNKWLSPFPAQKLVSSDYGIWGAEKRMFPPFVLRDGQGVWHALWGVSEKAPMFAHASSTDLINWKPQNFPEIGGYPGRNNCMLPEASVDLSSGNYLVTWLNTAGGDTTVVGCMTPDFHDYSSGRPVPGGVRKNLRVELPQVADGASGTIHRISRAELDNLIRNAEAAAYRSSLYSESPRDDAKRFAGLEPFSVSLRVDGSEPRAISPMLMGIFFEDISRAADGGLYAELVQNRDFEYVPGDRLGSDPNWHQRKAWNVKGEGLTFEIDTVAPIHKNNPHYAVIRSGGNGGALVNEGFGGIAVEKGKRYDLSLFANLRGGAGGKLRVSLIASDGTMLCSATVSAPKGKWGKLKSTLVPVETDDNAVLAIEPLRESQIAVDMVSLFPRDTFKGRRNGLRRDLADTIAALRPRFVRFPGGCVAHGDGISNIYRWKNTIGPLEGRVPQRNIWGYHQTAGLGYHEYFEFCEDLGAEPLPVVAAGVPCQNSSCGGAGQQGGIPMDEMPQYVQDVLDLIEYANGDSRTTRWGRERARNGHPAPFNLKYLGVGNEDLISEVFEPRFEMIFKAVRERYPEIVVIGTVGPFHEGSDYTEGWEFATRLGVPMVDEHYYETPSWFVYNQDFYDGYDRNRPHVYLGEYASQGNKLYNALAEAAYLCGLERNGDVVEMTSYAPLLAKEGKTNWNPDMIYFTNTEVKPTVNYRVQRLFGENCGVSVLPSALVAETAQPKNVAVRLASSVVMDEDGSMVVKLVNILPVEVSVDLDAESLLAAFGTAQSSLPESFTRTVLAGNDPTSRKHTMTVETLSKPILSEPLKLSPYSFTVLRFSASSSK